MHTSEGTTAAASRWWTVALAALVVSVPFSLVIEVIAAGQLRSLKIPLVDGVLWGTVLCAVAARSHRLFDVRLWAPTLAVVAVSVLASLSGLHLGASLTECLQRLDYFLLAYLVAMAAPRDALQNALGPVLIGTTLLFFGAALVQACGLGAPPWLVTSFFPNRQLFNAWSAVALALVLGSRPPRTSRDALVAGVLVVLAILTSTTLLPIGGAAVGITTGLYWRYGRGALLALPVVLVVLLGASALLSPAAVFDRVMDDLRIDDVTSVEAVRERGAEIDEQRAFMWLGALKVGESDVRLWTPNWHREVKPRRDPRREEVFEPGYVRQRFLEWQAALFALGEHPVFGTGLGSYQAQSSRNYLSFKKFKTLEADTQNGYAVEAVSAGLAGLAALFWFLVASCGSAAALVRDAQRMRSLSAWSPLGGLLAAAMVGFAVPLFQSSLAVLLVLMAAAANRGSIEAGKDFFRS